MSKLEKLSYTKIEEKKYEILNILGERASLSAIEELTKTQLVILVYTLIDKLYYEVNNKDYTDYDFKMRYCQNVKRSKESLVRESLFPMFFLGEFKDED